MSAGRGLVRRTLGAAPRRPGVRLAAFQLTGRRLLAAAALLHVALVSGMFLAGRAQVAPGLIDGDGVVDSFAADSHEYKRAAVRLAGILRGQGFSAWAAEPERAHVKIISAQFALLGPLFGDNILSVEPLNLLCYVAILWLVFLLGREAGGRRVGTLAAAAVALWPTFLLHTTQLLKDPLFIAAALGLVLMVTTWLTRDYGWPAAAGTTTLAAALAWLLLLIRPDFVVVVVAVVMLGLALLVVRQLLERRALYGNMICPLALLAAAALAPLHAPFGELKMKQRPARQAGRQKSDGGPGIRLPAVVSRARPDSGEVKRRRAEAGRLYAVADTAAYAVGHARRKFDATYPESGSSVDRGVEIKNLKGLVLYLPRALAVGLWSPFPGAWLGTGKHVGSAGRLLSGAETLIIYLCELLALLAVWRSPRGLACWLLLSVTALGVTALALVVPNVGTLYRLRYAFWILLIVLAAKGASGLFRNAGEARPKAEGPGKKSAAVAAAACLLVACACSSSSAPAAPGSSASRGALDFTLVNFTDATMAAVHVSPHASPSWEENLLGRDAVIDGEYVRIGFGGEEDAALWDLRVEDAGGNYAELRGLDLREISELTLRRGDGLVVAEAE